MGEHSTSTSLNFIEFLTNLGDGLGYFTDTEYPMNEKSFGGQAIDIAWFNEMGSRFPLFIFEVESTSNNSIANNPTKIFGKDSKVFEKPLFFFHIIIDGADNSEKYSDLLGLFGKYNYDIFRLNNGDVENLLVKIISQHRRIRDEVDLKFIIRLINDTKEVKSKIVFERFLTNVERLINENQFYRLGQAYADIASRDKEFNEQYLKYLHRLFQAKHSVYSGFENYCAAITSEFINLGLLYSNFQGELSGINFTDLLVEAQKTETFSKIDYLPGLNYDYDVFIFDYVPFYLALTFFLFNGNLSAQKYILDISVKIIRKLNPSDSLTFEHHVSWGLLMSAYQESFTEYFDELKDLVNNRDGILDTILYCPTYRNEHQVLSDSKLILVPNRVEYLQTFKQEFLHLSVDTNIAEIAIKSLSEDWKDELDYHFNLGVDLANWALKSLANVKP